MFKQRTVRYRQALCLVVFAAIILLVQTPATAQSIPTTLGWYQLSNSKLRSVCPSPSTYPQIQGSEGCSAVVEDWSGGAFDTKRNRLLITGGGHSGYAGNEIYALDLNSLTMVRINSPSTVIRDGCSAGGTYADGKPVSRHTYNHLEYLPIQDAMFMWGGSQWQCGFFRNDTWFFDLNTLTWTAKNSTNGPTTEAARSAAYDAATGLVYLRDDFNLRSYNPATDTWTQRSSSLAIGGYKTAVIDPVRKRYVLHGNNSTTLYWYDISSPTATGLSAQSVATSGCSGVIGNGKNGIAYDPVQDKIVMWNGGNTIYLLNPNTYTCTTVTYSGGPAAVANGTYGRFRYVPSLNIFAVCNSVDADCYTLRLTSGGATPPPSFNFALSNGGNQSVTQGQSGANNLTAALVSGSAQIVDFSASGVPSGASANFTAGSCMTTCSTSLNIITSPTTPAGSYPITVTAVGGGITRTSNFNLTVNATTTPPPPGTTADADFQARCSAAGVIKCWGFDNPATDLVLNTHVFAGTSTTPSQDTSVKTSGAGALRFTLPPPPHGGANMAGKWEPQGTGLGATFGANSSFYVQFRMRVSPEMLTNSWNSSWKFFELLYNNSTCGNTGLIFVNQNMKGVIAGYSQCGARMIGAAGPGGSLAPPSPPYSIQQFDDGRKCDYPEWSTANHPHCLYFKANTWMTFTYKVDVGGLNQSNGRIQAWYSDANTPVTHFLDTGFAYPIIGPSTGTVLNTANFSTYMTSLSSSSGLPGVTSYMWIDEFIVSTQPIAQPGAAPSSPTPPAPPSNLVLQ